MERSRKAPRSVLFHCEYEREQSPAGAAAFSRPRYFFHRASPRSLAPVEVELELQLQSQTSPPSSSRPMNTALSASLAPRFTTYYNDLLAITRATAFSSRAYYSSRALRAIYSSLLTHEGETVGDFALRTYAYPYTRTLRLRFATSCSCSCSSASSPTSWSCSPTGTGTHQHAPHFIKLFFTVFGTVY